MAVPIQHCSKIAMLSLQHCQIEVQIRHFNLALIPCSCKIHFQEILEVFPGCESLNSVHTAVEFAGSLKRNKFEIGRWQLRGLGKSNAKNLF